MADSIVIMCVALCLFRYQLGGPNSLRGFELCGAGPRAYRPEVPLSSKGIIPAHQSTGDAHPTDSLGGDLRSTLLATLSVPVPVPLLAKSQLRAFTFINLGMISSLSRVSSSAPAFGLGALRASVGGGFSLAAAESIRLETTYAIPILSAPQDQLKKFQIGVGVTIN